MSDECNCWIIEGYGIDGLCSSCIQKKHDAFFKIIFDKLEETRQPLRATSDIEFTAGRKIREIMMLIETR